MLSIIKAGNQEINVAPFADALTESGTLVGIRHFVAAKHGLSLASVKGKTFKEIKEIVGDTKAVKEWSSEYDVKRQQFYSASKQIDALSAADPNMRSEVRLALGKDGNVIGFNKKSRFVKLATGSKALADENATLRAELAAIKQLLLKA
ncbi:MAG: hypothetical protein ABI162_06890 [Luteolibacter sp.]